MEIGRKRGPDKAALPLREHLIGDLSRLSQDYLRYRRAISEVARYRDDVLSPWASNINALAASTNYHVDVDCKANYHLANFNAPYEL